MKSIRKLLIILVLSTAISIALAITAAAANIAYGAATVSANTLNLRSSPSTSSSIVTTMSENDIVVILEKTNSEWFYINFCGTKGYASAEYFKDVLTAENFNAIGRVAGADGGWVNIRSTPSTSAKTLASYPDDVKMTVIGINNGWYKVKHDGLTGYIRSDYMEIIEGYKSSVSSSAPSSSSSSSSSSQPVSYTPSSESLSEGEKIAEFALAYVGSRYVYGGTSPSGFDCSGLVFYTYKNFGYSLQRSAGKQYNKNGTAVAKSDLIPGDLVFFSTNGSVVTHVGIYIGEGEFVHASTSSTGVIISRLDSTYYTKVWFGARRIV